MSEQRYQRIPYRRCGRWGLQLPAISLGCWHNFGAAGTDTAGRNESDCHQNCRAMLRTAFDHGITHFDLANNYGPPPGSAEERVGRILRDDFAAHRDELIISSKAGYRMQPGPYGDGGSRKYLLASLDASLRRLQLDYVDIFYHHRPDPDTPLEETLGALDQAVRSGKALYVGISSYSGAGSADVFRVCEREGFCKPIIQQPNYSMLRRNIESDLLDVAAQEGFGIIAFCPLAQGLLTDKYLDRVPDDSRVRQAAGFLQEDRITPGLRTQLRKLNDMAQARGQSLAQFALAWTLRDARVSSALIGASRPQQISENVAALDAGPLSDDECARVDAVLEATCSA